MIAVPIPGLRLVSESNRRDHWASKAARVKAQRNIVTLVLRGTIAKEMMLLAPLLVTITRIAPRRLDDDNAVSSAKACRDSVAAVLGIDDRDPRVQWVVRQAQGPYGVHITVEANLEAK